MELEPSPAKRKEHNLLRHIWAKKLAQITLKHKIKSQILRAGLLVLAYVLFGMTNFTYAAPGVMESQTATSAVVGLVLTPEGSPLAKAAVVVENLRTHQKFQAVSDAAGRFLINGLAPDEYKLEVVKEGYKAFFISKLPLAAGDQAKAMVHMQEGRSSERIEGRTDSVTSRVGTALAGKELNDIPENQRNFVNLAQLSSGANEGNTNGANSEAQPGAQHASSSVSVGGQLEMLNNNMIDGIDNNERKNLVIAVHPSVDAIAEMRVVGSVYSVAQGRAGGGVIDITTKSGTKSYHGSIYEYFRNDDLDAYPYLFGAHTRKPEVRQNQYGGSVGGPLWKQKTAFFVDYEGFRLIQGRPPAMLTVPTKYEHDNPGDFTDIGGTKLTSLDSAGLQYFKLYPYPNSGSNTYVSAPSGSNFSHTGDLRIDHRFSPKDSIFSRYSYNHSNIGIPSAFPDVEEDGITIHPGGQLYTFAGTNNDMSMNGVLSYTHTFSPNLTLNVKGGYTLWRQSDTDLNPNHPVNQIFGQTGINVAATSNGLAPVSVVKASSLGNSGYSRPVTQVDSTFTYKGMLNWNLGRHNLSIGGGLIRRQWSSTGSGSSLGSWTVYDLTSLLQGQFLSVQRQLSLAQPHYRSWESSGFIQDEWNAVHNLTVSVGVRYDVYTNPNEVKNQLINFDTMTGKIVEAGVNGASKTANVNTDYSSFMPRVGFNWTPDGATSIHGGFGMVSTLAMSDTMTLTSAYGVCSSSTCTDGYTTLAAGLPQVSTPDYANPSGNLSNMRAKNLKNIYMEQFNLGIDRSFGKFDSVQASYVGSLGRHLTQQFPDLNAPAPNKADNPNILRPYYSVDPKLTSIGYTASGGNSSYNALQASYAHSSKYGVSANLRYTLAHGLDNARPWNRDNSGFGTVVSKAGTIDYGNSTFDVRQHLVATVKYELPFGKTAIGARRIVEKGWQFNVMEIWGTGLPYTILNAKDVSGTNPTASAADRSDVVGNPNLSNKGVKRFFNTDAFHAQKAGELGNERRNQYYGPHSRHVDVSLFKNFQLPREMTMQFRTECFNLTNTANFASPGNTLDGANFGQLTQITNGYTPREIQFALRMQF